MKIIVSFQEEKKIIEAVDKIASNRGTDRSAIIRECIRKELRRIEEMEETIQK